MRLIVIVTATSAMEKDCRLRTGRAIGRHAHVLALSRGAFPARQPTSDPEVLSMTRDAEFLRFQVNSLCCRRATDLRPRSLIP